jgi:hypothetical protein
MTIADEWRGEFEYVESLGLVNVIRDRLSAQHG